MTTQTTYPTRFKRERIREVYWKSCLHEGWLNILIYRPIAIVFAVAAARIHLSPNQVTMLSFVCSMIAAGMLLPGNYGIALLSLIPIHLGKILDCSDGQLASLTGRKSALGAFLDPFLDRVVDVSIFGALAIGHFLHTGQALALYLYMGLLAAWFIAAYLDKSANQEHTENNLETLRHTTGFLPLPLRRFTKWDGGFAGFITTVAVVFGWTPALLILMVVVTVLPIPIALKNIIRAVQ